MPKPVAYAQSPATLPARADHVPGVSSGSPADAVEALSTIGTVKLDCANKLPQAAAAKLRALRDQADDLGGLLSTATERRHDLMADKVAATNMVRKIEHDFEQRSFTSFGKGQPLADLPQY